MKGLRRFLTLVLFGFLSLSIAACNDLNYEAPNGENVGAFASYGDLLEYLETNYEEDNTRYYSSNDMMLEGAATTTTVMDSGDQATDMVFSLEEPDVRKPTPQEVEEKGQGYRVRNGVKICNLYP